MSWTTVYLLPFIKNKILKNIFYIWRHQRYTIRRFRGVVSYLQKMDSPLTLKHGQSRLMCKKNSKCQKQKAEKKLSKKWEKHKGHL